MLHAQGFVVLERLGKIPDRPDDRVGIGLRHGRLVGVGDGDPDSDRDGIDGTTGCRYRGAQFVDVLLRGVIRRGSITPTFIPPT